MAAPKGNNYGKGNKRGQGKKTTEAIERIEKVLALLEETLDADIEALSEKDRVHLWNDLQEYIRPKLSRTESKISVDESITEISVNVKKSKS